MDDKHVYLHAGCPKTGTTALQAYLYKNHEALKAGGFLYPRVGLAKGQLGHHNLVRELSHSKAHRLYREQQGGATALAEEIRRHPDKHILLSSEAYTECLLNNDCNAEYLEKTLPGFLGRPVSYQVSLRRVDLWLESLVCYNLVRSVLHAQTPPRRAGLDLLKSRIDRAIERDQPTFDIQLVQRLKQQFGSGRLALIPTDDILAKYAEAVGLDRSPVPLEPVKGERNVTDKKLTALVHLMLQSPAWEDLIERARKARGALKAALLPVPFKFRFVSQAQVKALLGRYLPIYQQLEQAQQLQEPLFDDRIDDYEYVPSRAVALLFEEQEKDAINGLLNHDLFRD